MGEVKRGAAALIFVKTTGSEIFDPATATGIDCFADGGAIE
jgi:hypothetical protein